MHWCVLFKLIVLKLNDLSDSEDSDNWAVVHKYGVWQKILTGSYIWYSGKFYPLEWEVKMEKNVFIWWRYLSINQFVCLSMSEYQKVGLYCFFLSWIQSFWWNQRPRKLYLRNSMIWAETTYINSIYLEYFGAI